MLVKIEVTEKDVKAANRARNKAEKASTDKPYIFVSGFCPIAQALKRVIAKNWKVEVSGWDVDISNENYSYVVKLPKAANDFIETWDTDRKTKDLPKPFTLNLKRDYVKPEFHSAK